MDVFGGTRLSCATSNLSFGCSKSVESHTRTRILRLALPSLQKQELTVILDADEFGFSR